MSTIINGSSPSITFSDSTTQASAGLPLTGGTLTGTTTFTGGIANANGFGVGTAVPSSGSGIAFPATQYASSDANTLDDYEEGTWSPVAASSTNSITAYTSNGSYTKIGRTVFIIGNVALTTVGSAGGILNIAGLPFTTLLTVPRPSLPLAREDAATGVMYGGFVNGGGTTMSITTFTYTAIQWTNGYNYTFVFTYQTT